MNVSGVVNNSIYPVADLPAENVQNSQSAAADSLERPAPAGSPRYSILRDLAVLGASSVLHWTVAAVGYAIIGSSFNPLGLALATTVGGVFFLFAGSAISDLTALRRNGESNEQTRMWELASDICIATANNLFIGMGTYLTLGMVYGRMASVPINHGLRRRQVLISPPLTNPILTIGSTSLISSMFLGACALADRIMHPKKIEKEPTQKC